MPYETIFMIIAGAVGIVIAGVLVVVILGFKDWMDRGSH